MYRLYVWGSIVVGVTSEQECLDFAWSKETTTVAFCFFPGNNSCVWSSKVNVKECYADGTGKPSSGFSAN
ncbi:hypothetical protein AAVH_06764 [Aphelenchoides avenae]|nr:hypothetical protein AAVH_06764 [Aphelenchus avenae]